MTGSLAGLCSTATRTCNLCRDIHDSQNCSRACSAGATRSAKLSCRNTIDADVWRSFDPESMSARRVLYTPNCGCPQRSNPQGCRSRMSGWAWELQIEFVSVRREAVNDDRFPCARGHLQAEVAAARHCQMYSTCITDFSPIGRVATTIVGFLIAGATVSESCACATTFVRLGCRKKVRPGCTFKPQRIGKRHEHSAYP